MLQLAKRFAAFTADKKFQWGKINMRVLLESKQATWRTWPNNLNTETPQAILFQFLLEMETSIKGTNIRSSSAGRDC